MLKLFVAMLLLSLATIVAADRKPVVTLILGLWNIRRGDLGSYYKRTFQYYLSYFEKNLQTDSNMIIFGDKNLQQFVQEKRKNSNTHFILKDLDSFHNNWQTSKMIQVLQSMKKLPNWDQRKGLPYFGLEMYNPIVMSKLFLMKEALEHDVFDSDFFVWADAGTLHIFPDDEAKDYVNRRYLQNFIHLYQGPWYFNLYEYDVSIMWDGYANGSLPYLSRNVTISEMILANQFGGRKQVVSTLCGVYQNFMRITLQHGDMVSDETIFSMMIYRFPYLIPLVNIQHFATIIGLQKIQSHHYLVNDQHRKFKINMDRTYQYEELTGKKKVIGQFLLQNIENVAKLDLIVNTANKVEHDIVPEESSHQSSSELKHSQYKYYIYEKLLELKKDQIKGYLRSSIAVIQIPKLIGQYCINYKFAFCCRLSYIIALIFVYCVILQEINRWKSWKIWLNDGLQRD